MDPLLAFCDGLTDELAPQAAAIEAARRVPPALMRRLAALGLFRRALPRACGGDGDGPRGVLEALRLLARADSSVGWCAMISTTAAAFAAYMDPEAARRLFVADPEALAAGVFAPRGRAVAVDGGYSLTGRWEFASHCENVDWIGLGGLVAADGGPAFRLFFVPTAAIEVAPRWDVLGLRGTGSHDVGVDEVHVPEALAVPLTDVAAPTLPFFGWLALCVAAVALGVAEAALTAFTTGARRAPASGKPLTARASTQQALAAAIGRHAAARLYLLDEAERAWAAVQRGEPLDLTTRARLRLAACEAVGHAVAVVDAAYHELGGASIRDGDAVQRRFRDIHTLTQHLMVGPAARDMAARVLAGVPVDTSTL